MILPKKLLPRGISFLELSDTNLPVSPSSYANDVTGCLPEHKATSLLAELWETRSRCCCCCRRAELWETHSRCCCCCCRAAAAATVAARGPSSIISFSQNPILLTAHLSEFLLLGGVANYSYKVLDKMLGRHFFRHSFDCWPKTTALRDAIFSMYILMISRKLASKGICHQSYYEVTRVFFPYNVFWGHLQRL